jgi:hypothetical protein
MKRLKLSLAATALALIFSVSASAGEILCGVTSQPPSQPQSATATSETSVGVSAISETASGEALAVDPVTEIALNVLQSVLSLF